MSDFNLIRTIGDKVLKELIDCYHSGSPYYLTQTIGYLFENEEDSLYVSDEEIIKHVKKLLSDKYTLEVTPIERTFTFNDEGKEDFTFQDVELKIILK